MNALNITTRKNGGLRFVKVGRFFFAFCVCKEYRPLMPAVAKLQSGLLADPVTYCPERKRYLTREDRA